MVEVSARGMCPMPAAVDAELVRQMLARNQDKLEEQLLTFQVRVQKGETGGDGVLGQVAEFLVSQRGLTR